MNPLNEQSQSVLKKIAFYTLGCKLNFAETSMLKKDFDSERFLIVPFKSKADIYVINTCSVTTDAERDCRKVVRQALRKNPSAFVVVTGCYAQLDPEVIAGIEGVDLVLGAKEKFDIVKHSKNFKKHDQAVIHRKDVNEAVDFHHAFSSSDRTRVFLKIQDGCDYKCSFCTIPLARGQSRSPSIEEILEQARIVIKDGYKEIILTGVNAGDFGKQTGETFYELLLALDKLDGLERIRISSIEPNLLSHDIIDLAARSTTIQPHFHIPLQSGSDHMLRIMKRRYDTALYTDRVKSIREKIPDACIGVDVITGHPGETPELFQETVSFLQSLDISYLHVFTYSERPDTLSYTMEKAVDVKERKKRTHILRNISRQKRYDFHVKHIGSIRQVLIEDEQTNAYAAGWTDNYIRVVLKKPALKVKSSQIIQCKLIDTDAHQEAVFGDIIS
ncbi:tRNA (N(6)-L-threonylcarbamoyladenosine(37)-C(2))-methylthiotransferase MtaB [Balneolaceae bacterium ANBcel3]|nr:tRNA (N(6)-L-threonylcarbamoyladenosine(37)-C(2))-methylthiotransferase MtaB [Balneolaceae bacterium ANBcel3]